MASQSFTINPHTERGKKTYLEKRERVVLNWKQFMVNIIALENSVTRNFSLLTEELFEQYGSREFRNYGHHPSIQKFFDRIFADCHTEVRKSSEFLTMKIDEMLSDLFTVMHIYTELSLPKDEQFVEQLFEIVSRNTELMMFIQANVQTIKAVFNSRLDAFERVTYRDFYKYVLEQKDECFKAFLLHPSLILAHFLCSTIFDSFPEAFSEVENLQLVDQNYPKEDKFKETQNERIMINMNTGNHQQPSANSKDIRKLLVFQEDFFKNRQKTLLEKLEIPPEEYFNVEYFKSKSAKLLADRSLTLDQLLVLSKQYPKPIHSKAEVILKNPSYNQLDLWMVFIHTFFFIMNIYGLAMTSYLYARSLELDSSISGIIQACTPGGSFIFGFWLNYWTQSNRYKIPYITVLTMLFVANLLYFLAETYTDDNSSKALIMLIVARVLMGIGGARLMTRKYVAINVQVWALTKYSAILTGITAFGMCFGPGISALIEFAKPTMIGDAKLEIYNIFAFMFVFIWGVMIFIFLFLFKGYDDTKEQIKEFKEINTPSQVDQVLTIEQIDLQKNLSQILEISENPHLMNNSHLTHQELELLPPQSPIVLWIYHPDKMTLFSLICFLFIKVR